MVEHAENEQPPPPELQMAWQCLRWKCLPDAGGYYDQDYRLMRLMTASENIHAALIHWRSLSGKAIHSLPESDRRILRALKDMGLMFQ